MDGVGRRRPGRRAPAHNQPAHQGDGQPWRKTLPRQPVSDFVKVLLEILNDTPTLSLPRLPQHIIESIYTRTKRKLAPNAQEDEQTLVNLLPHLFDPIQKAKSKAAQQGAIAVEAPREIVDLRRRLYAQYAARTQQSQPRSPVTDLHNALVGARSQIGIQTQQLGAVDVQMASPTGTPVLDNFLASINAALSARLDGELLSHLQIEPPFSPVYNSLIAELRNTFRKGSEDLLQDKCAVTLTETGEDNEGGTWGAMVKFMVCYLTFIRDVDAQNLLDTYRLLSDLQQKANTALTHPTKGRILLNTVIAYAKVFARLAIALQRNPELIAHLVTGTVATEEDHRETLAEKAANIIRNAFVLCLNDRNTTPSGVQKNGKPDGKKVAVYKLANICLKIFFQCGKEENSEQIFTNIQNSSPPISCYPVSDRVTYLQYLGRFHFFMNHFYPALLALQQAYDECPVSPSCVRQRRLILVYLVSSNMVLGRFPSEALYSRPEARGFRAVFHPICRAIARGDLESFRRLTSCKAPNAPWFLQYRIWVQIENRCEVLLWRSIFRKMFLLVGDQGDEQTRRAPNIELAQVSSIFAHFEKRALIPLSQLDGGPGRRHTNWIFMSQDPPPSAGYIDPDFEGLGLQPEILLPDVGEMESICSSLIALGFLNGFISHRLKRFVIQGAKRKGGALAAGFPNIWEVIKGKNSEECPGWKEGDESQGVGTLRPGMVLNLSGARPVGGP